MDVVSKLIILCVFLGASHLKAYTGRGPIDEDKAGLRNEKPAYLDEIGVDEKLGDTVSLDNRFTTEEGKSVPLQKFFNKKPVFLMLVYFNCPTLCSTHLNSVMSTLKEMSMRPGSEYEFVIVSIDEKEDSELASEKKALYLEEYGLTEYKDGIHFLTGEEENIRQLSSEVGFNYFWDVNMRQWAHSAASFILTPEGKVSFYHYGISINPAAFRLSLVEASEEKIGDVMDQVMLYCLRYDPNKKTYALYAFNIMRILAGLVAVILGIFIFRFWRNNKNA